MGVVTATSLIGAQMGAWEAVSWPWVIGIALAVVVVFVVYLLVRAGRGPDKAIRLVVTKGVHTGEIFSLASAFATVGSEKDNDITLTDDKISKHHARLKYHSGRLEVTDLNTLYGTSINGTRIEKGDCSDGDILALGSSFECRVEIDGGR